MIEQLRKLSAACLFGVAMMVPPITLHAETSASKLLRICYVELEDDPRYANRGAIGGIVFRDFGRPYEASQVALDDARAIGRVIRTDFGMERAAGRSADDLEKRIESWMRSESIHFVLADLPASTLVELGRRLKDEPVLLFNVSAPDDSLRGSDCLPNIFHTYPSDAMLSDALVQYLATKGWMQILVLQGPEPQDAASVEALQHSAKKFGAKIVDVKPFVLSRDPRNRTQSNVVLMTEGRYDVVYVADVSSEFGRYVPYQTALPRPVVGGAGLMPTAWSWNWDRDAAVQLQHRYEKLAPERRMNGAGWAAWEAVKAITQATVRTKSTDFELMKTFLLSDKLTLDTVKGNPGSFRPWDHQLRAPVLLATADAVIARAPLPQFLHQTNVLDTLGVDAPESTCHF